MESNALLVIFLSLNVAFLAFTAVWFRVDHASASRRFAPLLQQESLVLDEVRWQYSLRRNLLLCGCALSAYLLYVGESMVILVTFAAMSLVSNVATDFFYQQFPETNIFLKAKKAHIVASLIIWIVTVIYFVWRFLKSMAGVSLWEKPRLLRVKPLPRYLFGFAQLFPILL